MLSAWQTAKLSELHELFPDYECWVVPCFMTPDSWCARPRGAATSTHVCTSADELQAELAEDLAAKARDEMPDLDRIMRKHGP